VSELNLEEFATRFKQVVTARRMTWEALGFLTTNDQVYPFGTDTKVLSTVFEVLTAPVIQEIVKDKNYIVEGAVQTVYPDFTLTPPDGRLARIALDIKTTYRSFNRQGRLEPFRYTLGSYTSFLRSPGANKNIQYPYNQYQHHWVIGFLYTRTKGVSAKTYRRSEMDQLTSPYHDVEYFVQEKYKITGVSPGSGNTANIGSFPTRDINELRAGNGPFAKHGKEICDEYWRHYVKTKNDRPYSNLDEFLAWRRQHQ